MEYLIVLIIILYKINVLIQDHKYIIIYFLQIYYSELKLIFKLNYLQLILF